MVGHWPRVVRTDPGPGTATGEGDIIVDDHGNRYRIVSSGEASILRNSTGDFVWTLYSDGTIR